MIKIPISEINMLNTSVIGSLEITEEMAKIKLYTYLISDNGSPQPIKDSKNVLSLFR